MGREPFVWELQVQQEVLDDAVAELRQLPYAVVREIIDAPRRKKMVGRDEKRYTLSVVAASEPGSETIRVTVTLRRGWFARPLVETFTVRPDQNHD